MRALLLFAMALVAQSMLAAPEDQARANYTNGVVILRRIWNIDAEIRKQDNAIFYSKKAGKPTSGAESQKRVYLTQKAPLQKQLKQIERNLFALESGSPGLLKRLGYLKGIAIIKWPEDPELQKLREAQGLPSGRTKSKPPTPK